MSGDGPVWRHELSEAEAADAMREFLSLHVGHSGDTPAILAALVTRQPDGFPNDPAAWIDWLICIRKVKGLDASEDAAIDDAIAAGGWLAREVAAWRATGRGERPSDSRSQHDVHER